MSIAKQQPPVEPEPGPGQGDGIEAAKFDYRRGDSRYFRRISSPHNLPISPEGDAWKGSDGLSDEGLMEIGEVVRLAEEPISAQLVDTSLNYGIVDAAHHDDPAGP